MEVVVGTTNPLKIEAVKDALYTLQANVHGLKWLESAVSEEPMGRDETLKGAIHRACVAKNTFPGARMWIGIESGFTNESEDWIVFVSLVVLLRKIPDGEETEQVEIWSEPLLCPITKRQRQANITAALKNWLQNIDSLESQ